MSDSDASRKIVADAYEAVTQGNFKGFLGVFDERIVVSEPACLPYGGTFTGVKEVIGMLGKAGPYLDSGKLVVEYLAADGDRVAALLRIPLRDGSGEATIAEHWLLRDGKAVELSVFWSDPSVVPAAA
jgi:ketosteroid isomerase-like protein